MVKKSKGFTLVELLAVIVILAVILVIAVPQIMSTITESRMETLSSSAKLIASSAETAYMSNQTLGVEKNIECRDISNYTDEDYASCKIKFVDGKAKVKLIGQGKFEGMAVCGGTKENAEVVEECPIPVSFADDDWDIISEAVKDGNTSKYNVGDIKIVDLGDLGTHTLRIANKTACDGTLESQTACGFVIEFADIVTTHYMNDTRTNAGGWPGSKLYSYVNGTIYNALPEELRNAIKPTKVVSSHGSTETTNFTTENVKLYLLSTREVWGKEGTGNTISYDSADGNEITRQLDYYKNNNVSTSSYSGVKKKYAGYYAVWWLRSAYSNVTDDFYIVMSSGDWNGTDANSTNGVSPAFRLG